MTGYHLSIGYISGYTGWMRKDEAFKALIGLVVGIRENPLLIKPTDASQGPWTELHERVSDNYRVDGPAMRVLEDSILLCCSGGQPYRKAKEETAMHACIYLVRRMAKLGIPLSLTVA